MYENEDGSSIVDPIERQRLAAAEERARRRVDAMLGHGLLGPVAYPDLRPPDLDDIAAVRAGLVDLRLFVERDGSYGSRKAGAGQRRAQLLSEILEGLEARAGNAARPGPRRSEQLDEILTAIATGHRLLAICPPRSWTSEQESRLTAAVLRVFKGGEDGLRAFERAMAEGPCCG